MNELNRCDVRKKLSSYIRKTENLETFDGESIVWNFKRKLISKSWKLTWSLGEKEN